MSVKTSSELIQEKSKTEKYVILGLVLVQFLATLSLAHLYFALVRDGVAPILGLLFCVISSICLYIAVLMQFFKHPRANLLFKIAAVGLGASVPMWGLSHSSGIVAFFGAVLGVVGWWVTREKVKKEIVSDN